MAFLGNSEPKLIGGIGFWLVAGLMLSKDIFDLFSTAIGLIAGATGVGLVLTAFLTFIGWGFTGSVFIVQLIYYFIVGVPLGSKNLAILTVDGFIEAIPILGMFPVTTMTFFAIRFIENKKRRMGAKTGSSLRKMFNALSPAKL